MNSLYRHSVGSAASCSSTSSSTAFYRRAPQATSSSRPIAPAAGRSSVVGAVATLRHVLPSSLSSISTGDVGSPFSTISRVGGPLPFSTIDECDDDCSPEPLKMPSANFAAASPAGTVPLSGANISDLTPETFYDFLAGAGNDVVVVDYYTDWCGPCKVMSTELKKLTTIFKSVRFAKFDVGKHEGAFATRQGIRRLPTFRVYRNGRVLDELTGARPVELRQLLVHHNRPAFALRSQDNI